MTRKPFVGGNWKMNGSTSFISNYQKWVKESDKVDVVIAPPYPYLEACKALPIKVAAQNCFHKASGAYTGEIAPEMLIDLGIEWVILGHSERRHGSQYGIHESSQVIADKTNYALSKGLNVILCIGETLEQYENKETKSILNEQLAFLNAKTPVNQLVIAYEPVWAIGTGKVATPEYAQSIHNHIRSIIPSQSIRIIYGGSVNPSNAKQLMNEPDIDGFLVGGASLKQDFFQIIDLVE